MQTSHPAVRDIVGGSVAWREAGPGTGPAAVFLHGLGGGRASWEPQLAGLAGVRRVLAWDQPGYGHSPGRPGSLPELAAVAARWLDELGGGPVDVVGLSFGGMVAQHLALDHPHLVRTLALLDSSPAFGLDGVTTREEWLASRVVPSGPDEDRGEWAEQAVAGIVGPDCPAEARAEAAAVMRGVPAASLAAACRALVDHDVRDRLHRIQAPTLVLVGAQDRETPPAYSEAIAAAVPGARLVVVPGAGHLLNVEAPDVVNDHLLRHWAAADEAGRQTP